jgi:VWFA-related protein
MTGTALIPVIAGLSASAIVLLAAAPTQQPFRSATDVVTLEAAVLQDNKPVAGLSSRDFIVTDNGVRQTVEVVSAGSLPVDLSLVIDMSGSMSESVDEMKRQILAAAAQLRPEDRCRFVQFSWGVQEVFPMQPVSAGLSLDRFSAGGATSLHDALAAVLMRNRKPGRAELAVVFTDAVDTSSAMTIEASRELARRSDVLLHAFIVRAPGDVFADAALGRPDYGPLTELAGLTGGRLDVVLADNHVANGLARALADFRSSYTLRFTATGVARQGWHELAVRIDRPGGFAVRARKGYFGG